MRENTPISDFLERAIPEIEVVQLICCARRPESPLYQLPWGCVALIASYVMPEFAERPQKRRRSL